MAERISFTDCNRRQYQDEQYRQFTYNLTMRRVLEIIVAVEKQ